MTDNSNNTHLYIPQRLAVKSMRDSGYKNTAYAVAELIDNSYQAIEEVQRRLGSHAGIIDVLLVERQEKVKERVTWRVAQIAVIDNGCGMTSEQLRDALQFGNGTHLKDRRGIGRFGMGLPNSTVSQCRRADIWTWRTGHQNAVTAHLDLDQIENDQIQEVPVPHPDPLPEEWVKLASAIESCASGTAVVWSDLDRVNWKTASSTIDNIEQLVGRIYRKLIADGLVINLVAVRDGEVTKTRTVRANDPLYLMAPTATPAPYHDTPMFRRFGQGTQKFPIEINGETDDVVVTLSWVQDEVRQRADGQNAGDTPHGKHARSNEGVSVMRARRELMLDTSWLIWDPRERWWGAEIEFPPALDEVFGVTNNKQAATNFADMAQYYLDTRNDDEWYEVREEWGEEGDPRLHLVDICNYLTSQIRLLRRAIADQNKGLGGAKPGKNKRHEAAAESAASTAFEERKQEGHDAGEPDQDVTPDDRAAAVEQDLIEKDYPAEAAKALAAYVKDNDITVVFVEKHDDERPAFFAPEGRPGITEIVFNTAHPAYRHLIEVLKPRTENEDAARLRQRIDHAAATMFMLLAAWARHELEAKEGAPKDAVKEARGNWGRMAKKFLQKMELPDLGPPEE